MVDVYRLSVSFSLLLFWPPSSYLYIVIAITDTSENSENNTATNVSATPLTGQPPAVVEMTELLVC
jgi:hypothetical protein